MILLIDNYDSFVYNLARYISELGFACCVKRNDSLTLAEIAQLAPSHIVISPGPCAPLQAGITLALVREFAGKIPILGVCLGHQAIAAAFEGVIGRALKPLHGQASLITHTGNSIFADISNPLRVGRYHSLIVSEESFPDKLCVTARSAEGEIMALEHREFPLYGVQFHPESILTDAGHALLKNFFRIRI